MPRIEELRRSFFTGVVKPYIIIPIFVDVAPYTTEEYSISHQAPYARYVRTGHVAYDDSFTLMHEYEIEAVIGCIVHKNLRYYLFGEIE